MAPDGLLPPYPHKRKAVPRQGRFTRQVGGLEVAVAQRYADFAFLCGF